MTVRELINKTVDSYLELKINGRKGEDLVYVLKAERHKWNCTKFPEDVLDKKIEMIVVEYGTVIIEVEA